MEGQLARESPREKGSAAKAATTGEPGVYRELNESVFDRLLGADWRKQRVQRLDFSSTAFALETLSSADGGLLHPKLRVDQLLFLDLSDNALSTSSSADVAGGAGGGRKGKGQAGQQRLQQDSVSGVISAANGFRKLKELKLTRNFLETVQFWLPSLHTLLLDYNRLTSMPPLAGLLNLEVLNVSHNQIKGWWEGINVCVKLREFDMSHNKMDFLPTQTAVYLRVFSSLKVLRDVRLDFNPFSELFPEYAAILVNILTAAGNKQLQQVDGEPIAAEGRQAAAQQSAALLGRIHEFDDLYVDRQDAARVNPIAALPFKENEKSSTATVSQMIRLLEQTLQERPGKAVEKAALFLDLCTELYSSVSEGILKDLWKGVEQSENARKSLVKTLVENAMVLIERDERVRPLIVRGLAKLCVVEEGGMNVECLRVLSMLLQQTEDLSADEGPAEALAEIVIPALRSISNNEYLALTIIKGLATMKPSTQLAAALSSSISLLSDFLQIYSTVPSIYRVVAIACMLPENCVEATGQGIPQSITHTLLQTELPTTDSGRELYCDMCSIVGRCGWHVRKAALYMGKARLHVEVFLFYLRDLIGERLGTKRLTVLQAKLCHGLIMALIGMMHGDEQVLRECCDQYHVVDLLLPALKEADANPLILAASATGLRAILENEFEEQTLLQYVTRELFSLKPLLQYLGGPRYSALFHQAAYLESNSDSLNYAPETPPLSELQNSYVLQAFAALAKLIAFYLNREYDSYCVAVAEELCGPPHEKALLGLLKVRDNKVRLAAVECVAKIPLQFVQKDTLAELINLISSIHRPDHSNNSNVLRVVIEFFTHIVVNEESAAHARLLLDFTDELPLQVFSVLSRNVLFRSTTPPRKRTELDREKLSIACVNFLRRASVVQGLRASLRNKEAAAYLPSILKAEEEQLQHIAADAYEIAVERTWTGRDVKTISLSISGIDRLNPRMKVAFRVIARLADVLEGKPELFDARHDIISLPLLCKEETKMWEDRTMWNNWLYLDETERKDRAAQQADFARLAVGERLLMLLSPLASAATAQRYAKQRREKEDAEYWAGRLKADVEDMALDIARRAEKKAAREEAAATAAAACRSSSEVLARKPEGRKIHQGARAAAAAAVAAAAAAASETAAPPSEDEEADEAEDDPALANLWAAETPSSVKTRDRLMEVLMLSEYRLDPETAATYLQGGSEIYGSGGLWLNVQRAELHVSFTVAAFLRSLYACVFGATNAAVRTDLIRSLRRLTFLRKLVALVEACPALACHVAAKFFRLMKHVLVMEPTQPAESMDMIIVYAVVADCALRTIRVLLFVLKHAASRPLKANELILSAEIASLYALFTRQTPYIKFSNEYEAQRWAVEATFERLLPSSAVHAFVSMLLFDLQIDAGTPHGSYISHLFADLAPTREGMRIDCFNVLAEAMQRCPRKLSYECIEALQYARVFMHHPLRKSALYELLDDVNTGHFRATLELLLSEYGQHAERVLQIAVVRWWNQRKHLRAPEEPGRRMMLAISNYHYYLIEKPTGLREPETPEVEFSFEKSKKIRIEEKKSFRYLTRLVKGLPATGWLAVGWQEKKIDPTTGEAREDFDIFVCDKIVAVAPLLETLRVISGPSDEDRVEVLKDAVLRRCLSEVVEEKYMQAVAWVEVQAHETEEESRSKKKLSNYLAVVILTLTHYYEATVDWRYWFCLDPMRRQEAEAVEEELEEPAGATAAALTGVPREGLGNFVGWLDEEKTLWGDDDEIKQLRQEAIQVASSSLPSWLQQQQPPIQTGTGPLSEKRLAVARANLVTLRTKEKISRIHQVDFSGGEECVVEMTFGKTTPSKTAQVIRIKFLDDAMRERWRRALAKALNRTDASNQWMRFWKSH